MLDLVAQRILEDYDRDSELYAGLTDVAERLLKELLTANGILVHSVSSRMKDRNSLMGKLAKNPGKYLDLQSITDVSGSRIISYYPDEVDAIGGIIEQEFEVDRDNSVDKRIHLDPDQFGYLSLHYVVSLSKSRIDLTEFNRYQGMKMEIQIRSILQHVWAEIEHDLGYKVKEDVPRDIRRRFSRLAGLLETADDEFKRIRDERKSYAASVPAEIDREPETVSLDSDSLASFVADSDLVRRLDSAVAREFGFKIADDARANPGRHVEALHFLGLQTIADLNRAIDDNFDELVRFIKTYASNLPDAPGKAARGFAVAYLAFFLAARAGGETLIEFFRKLVVGTPESRRIWAERAQDAYERSTQTK